MSEIYPITKEDISVLLNRLKIELFRRSGWDKDGNPIHEEAYRHYNQPVFTSLTEVFTGDKFHERTIRESITLNGHEVSDDDIDNYGDEFLDLTIGEAIKLSESNVINAFQGHSLIGAIINICDVEDLRKVKEFDLIPGAFDKKTIEDFLSVLEADEFSTKTPHCRSACTGLCLNACTDTCVGACVGACSACSVNCVGGCSNTCDGCSSTCGTSCGVGCGTGCAAQATACSGCYSACSGCVACTDACTSGCSGCANQCSSCLAGCQGSSGYNNTCGCGSSCTSGCGGKASAVAGAVTERSLTFYHDRRVYGVKRVVPSGSIVMPDIVDCGNVFTSSTYPSQWMDEDGNKFNPGQTVRIAANVTSYNNLKSSGIAVTKSQKLISMIPRVPAYLCPPKFITSPDLNVSLMTKSKFSDGGSLTLPYSSTVNITSDDGFEGLSTEKRGVIIDSKYVILPYRYHHSRGTKITFIGGKFSVSYQPYPSVSTELDITGGSASFFVPYAEVSKIGENMFIPCEYSKNPHVGVYLDNVRIDGNTVATPSKVRLMAESLLDIHADGSYSGYRYLIRLEEFRRQASSYPYTYWLNGDTNSLHNAFVTVSADSLSLKYKIPLVQEQYKINSDMEPIWECTIPSRETMGFDSAVECLMIPECDGRPMVKVPFGSKVFIHTRQDFYLFPYIPQESEV